MPEEDSLSNRSTGFEPSTAYHDVPSPNGFAFAPGGHDTNSSYEDENNFGDDVPMISEEGVPRPHSVFNPDGTNTLYTVFLIVNAALGAGLLNFPMAFHEAGGIAVAASVQAFLIVFIIAALLILAYAADRCNTGAASTIQDAMNGACGRAGKMLTSLAVVVYCFGTTITFLIIIGDQFDRVLSSLYGDDFCNLWYMSRTFTISVTAIVFILPMCYSQRIDFLRLPSTLGVFAILYLVGMIVAEYYTGDYPNPGPIKVKPDHWTDVFLVVPQVCFGYQCHVSVIPIYSCMRHRTLRHFSMAAISAILICMFCYTFCAAFGYMTFGSLIKDDIMMSYSAKQPQVIVGILCLVLKTITTYPILLFCGREGLKSILSEGHKIMYKPVTSSTPAEASEDDGQPPPPAQAPVAATRAAASGPDFLVPGSKTEVAIRVGFVSLWFSASLILAIKIPNIGQVIKLLGSLAAVFIFVFPGLCLFKISYRSDPSFTRKWTLAKVLVSFIFLAFGAFIFGVVLTQSIQNIIDTSSSDNNHEPYGLMIRRKACDS